MRFVSLQPAMIKYLNHDIVFQEYPDEVTLAVNLTLCPHRCPGCHSVFLREDVGEELDEERLFALIDSYLPGITCVGLQGGDNDPERVVELLAHVRSHYGGKVRTGWYSGNVDLPAADDLHRAIDYIKTGPYIAEQGPLSSPTTNQRFYKVKADGTLEDLTHRFAKKKL